MLEILTDRVIIEVFGKDARALLQNLITNDLAEEQYIYTYMLNPQGKYLFDFFIFFAQENHYLIDLAKKQAPEFIARLNLFKLRSAVQIAWRDAEYKLAYSKDFLDIDFIYAKKDPRYKNLGVRSVIKSEAAQLWRAKQGVNVDSLYAQDKYNFAIPDGEIDLASAKSFPIEYGAAELNAISYSKGCYMGQEVVSRTKYQGVVRKKIFKITSNISGNICLSKIEKGAELTIKDLGGTKKIGIFTSGYKKQGIALIREEYATDDISSFFLGEIPVSLQKPTWR